MKLSVIIPVYNGAEFIRKSYDSIINQNVTDFEILYINNNSIDGSETAIKQIQVEDDRVLLLHQSKQGAAAARNMGITNAKGEYIYVFDVDDEIYSNALNRMIQVLDAYPQFEAVFGKMVKSNLSIDQTIKPDDETGEIIIKDPPYWGLQWFSSLKTVVGPPAFLYRKAVFDKIGLYNESIKNNEDTAFDIKLGMQCQVAKLDKYVYLYFKHETSTIQTSKRLMPRAFMIWPRLVEEHVPYYLSHDTPQRFKELLFSQLFQAMGRQLVFSKGFKKRQDLKKQLYLDVQTIRIPLIIRFYLSILVILPYKFLRKIYGYYIVPYTVKLLTK